MDKNGIDKAVHLTWVSPVDEYDPKYNPVLPDVGENEGPISFKSVLEMVKQEPDRFIPAYCPDPRKPEAIDNLMYAVDTYMAFTEDFLTEFQDRVCFCRDCFEVWHLDLMKSLKLDEKIKDKIYYKNASKLLKINIEE